MTLAGVSLGSVARLAREARGGAAPPGPLLVVGPLAQELVRLLAADGDASLVRTGGAVDGASAVIAVLGASPTAEQVDMLRRAARAGVAVIAVQTGPSGDPVPYVLAEDVVTCPPGQGFPVDEIAGVLCRSLGRRAAPLAARLPVLREAASRSVTERAAGLAAGVAAAPWGAPARLPVLVLLQAQMLRDLARASGARALVTHQDLAVAVAPELGAALGAGVGARALVRRLPRSRLVDGAVAGGVTLALAAAARLRPR